MDRTVFNLMSYPSAVDGVERTVFAFGDDATVRRGKRAGKILAPPGSTLIYGNPAPSHLMVPRGPAGQHVFSAAEAVERARAGEAGLSFEPEPGDEP